MIFDFLNACFVSNLESDDEVIWLLVDGYFTLVVRWQSLWYIGCQKKTLEEEKGKKHLPIRCARYICMYRILSYLLTL